MVAKEEGLAIEKGEYIIGIAIILASLLVSATVYISASGLQDAIGKLKLSVTVPSGGTQAQPTPTPTPQPAAPTGPVKLSGIDFTGANTQGNADGKVVFVEYSDFQCPYCGKVTPTVAQVKKDYTDVLYIFRHFPLSFHQYAQKAAEAAECAAAQGKFWEMHDVLFANQDKLTVDDLKKDAADLKLNTTKFNSCLDSSQTAAAVGAQENEGASVGIRGTPGFLIYSAKAKSGLEAKLSPIAEKLVGLGVDASVVEVDGAGTGIVFAGALPYTNFQEVMNAFN